MKKIDSMHKEMMLMKNFQEHITEDRKNQDDEILKLNEHIERLRVSLRQFKDAFDKVIIKMSEIKTEVKELRDRYEVATMENERLHVRAAAGFESLTPRPDYAKLVKENFCFDFDFYDKKEKRCLVRTDQTVEQLMKNLHLLASGLNKSHNIPDGKHSADSPKRRNSSMTAVRLNSPKERKSMMATIGANQLNKRSSLMPPPNSDQKEKKRTPTADKLPNPTIEESKNEEIEHVEVSLPVKLERNPNKNSDYGNYVLRRAEDVAREAIEIKNAMKAADRDI
jgi:regulator of replication initiation timing